MVQAIAKFRIGMQVKHRLYGFRGVVFDVDPVFANTEAWYESIPEERRPPKDQPFYHLFAETHEKAPYIAYVSEQNLMPDDAPEPIHHPAMDEYFQGMRDGHFIARVTMN